MTRAQLVLTAEERTRLEHLCHTAPRPYLRERAAALLKVADGQSAAQVARAGLLHPRKVETVCRWLARYGAEGVDGLTIRPGRGRKPAFSPPAAQRGRRTSRRAGRAAAGAAAVRP